MWNIRLKMLANVDATGTRKKNENARRDAKNQCCFTASITLSVERVAALHSINQPCSRLALRILQSIATSVKQKSKF
jgi:hypothetical protein